MLYVAALQVSRSGSKLVRTSRVLWHGRLHLSQFTETDKSKAVVYVASAVVNQHVDTLVAFSRRYKIKLSI